MTICHFVILSYCHIDILTQVKLKLLEILVVLLESAVSLVDL